MDCLASMDPSRVTSFWEKFVLSLGILFRPLSCCRIWDASQNLFAATPCGIQYASAVGKGGMSLPCNALVDAGLCILSTREPSEKGFTAYKTYPEGLHEERLANKGIMWAFWSTGGGAGLLVVNTHLSSKGRVRPAQLDELGVRLEAG
eukprot:Skav231455  [mRNA]  locus=scaffold1847:718056:718499:- [translate_table: standard]